MRHQKDDKSDGMRFTTRLVDRILVSTSILGTELEQSDLAQRYIRGTDYLRPFFDVLRDKPTKIRG